jgi:ribonuclease-3
MGDSALPGNDTGGMISELEELLGYRFKEPARLLCALTHRSFVNEQENLNLQHNESLEFLGDAILGFVISARLFTRFPDLSEGELSKIKACLVSSVNLARLSSELHLGDFLRLSRGEEKTGGRNKRAIGADAYEAVIGAIYLDGGIDAVFGFLDRQMGEYIGAIDPQQFISGDFKSALQERAHDLGLSEPAYNVIKETGPDHRKTFVVQVVIHNHTIAEASGRTKKEAQQAAASLALESLGLETRPVNRASPRVV